jgi:hypothetical protein
MSDDGWELLRKLYDLQIELFEHQGDEIEALRRANLSLQQSHETIGERLRLTADWLRVL